MANSDQIPAMNLNAFPPELLSALAQALGGKLPLSTTPKAPTLVTCYHKKTGKRMDLYRLDFKEHQAAGLVTTDPSEVEGASPAEVQDIIHQVQAGNAFARGQLDAMEVEALRGIWKQVHAGEDPHPRLGKQRLVDEIIATREAMTGVVDPKPAPEGSAPA